MCWVIYNILMCAVGCVTAVLFGLGNFNLSANGLAWHGSLFLVCVNVLFFL
ncbi:MAG: hypothetical protein LBF88_14185 [Planctomycetaceae bacterium]|nr:hypothetical protein [Planctomycetaceae bacterium]